ncbi:MAG: GntR family transcriptional regulator [Verrucomicrobia bacterium]|nr:GntR family transcriptional regulator [Verrucomicrobiota bacterium]
MKITIDPALRTPVYQQIVDEVKRLVGSGGVEPGARVASVRELSQVLGVNPATVAKAYRELVHEGLLRTTSKSGTFVEHARPRLSPEASRRKLIRALDRLFAELAPCDLDETELQSEFERRIDEFAAKRAAVPPAADEVARARRATSTEDWAVW